MFIKENINLAELTTFHIGGNARFFCAPSMEYDLIQAIEFAKSKNIPIFVLGGGSNILIDDKGFQGLVIKLDLKGIEESENDKSKIFKVRAGEIMDEFIEKTVNLGLYGLENLSYIPGTVGASPVQNIGAYGQEVGNVVRSVRVLDTDTLQIRDMDHDECKFAYRDSIFKQNPGRYIITQVTFALDKAGKPNLEYKDILEYFYKRSKQNPSPKEIRDAVIEIRSNKFPDWHIVGTAGSFFKNPIITATEWDRLRMKYPIPHFPEADGRVKISLAWILDKVCGLKGIKKGRVGTYSNQALVISADKGATSAEVLKFSDEIVKIVKEKIGLDIEREVQYVH